MNYFVVRFMLFKTYIVLFLRIKIRLYKNLSTNYFSHFCNMYHLNLVVSIVLLSCLDIINFVHSTSIKEINIPQLMDGVENDCDVMVLSETRNSVDLQYVYHNIVHPVNVFYVDRRTYRMTIYKDLSRGWGSTCKVAFLFYDLNKQVDGNKSFGIYLKSSDYEFRHTGDRSPIQLVFNFRNVYKILLLQKQSLGLLKSITPNYYNLYMAFSSYLGVLFSTDEKSFSLCVLPISKKSFKLGTMKCKTLYANIVQTFKDSLSVPDTWYLRNLEDTQLFAGFPEGVDFTKLSIIFNPFSHFAQNSTYEHLLQVLFSKANRSLLHYPANGREAHTSEIFLAGLSSDFFVAQQQFVLSKFQSYQFITCYSEKFISMSFFLLPFQPIVWGVLLTSVVCISLIVLLYIKLINMNEHFSAWLYVVAYLCDDSITVPKQLWQKNFFRLIAGSWILMSVVMTNCYTGLMISDLNSPMPSTNVPETFEDLICEDTEIIQAYKKGANLTEWIQKKIYELGKVYNRADLKFVSSPCFKILSAPSVLHGFQFLRLLEDTNIAMIGWKDLDNVTLETIITLLLGNRKHSFVPSGYEKSDPTLPNSADLTMSNNIASMEKDISSCLKYVLAVDGSDIAAEFEYLTRKYYWIKFYRRKDSLGSKPFGWTLLAERESKVPIYFKSLLETGIQGRLDSETQRRMINLRGSISKYPGTDNQLTREP